MRLVRTSPVVCQHTHFAYLYFSHSTHTTVLFAIILTFIFTVYATSDKIGSFAKMHELLAAVRLPLSQK